jgi:hypothetical protein
MDQSREEKFVDKEAKGRIGVEAVRKYYRHFRILDRVQE